jgi:hypothetical protein
MSGRSAAGTRPAYVSPRVVALVEKAMYSVPPAAPGFQIVCRPGRQ